MKWHLGSLKEISEIPLKIRKHEYHLNTKSNINIAFSDCLQTIYKLDIFTLTDILVGKVIILPVKRNFIFRRFWNRATVLKDSSSCTYCPFSDTQYKGHPLTRDLNSGLYVREMRHSLVKR